MGKWGLENVSGVSTHPLYKEQECGWKGVSAFDISMTCLATGFQVTDVSYRVSVQSSRETDFSETKFIDFVDRVLYSIL